MRSLKVSAVLAAIVGCCASILVASSGAGAATTTFSDVPRSQLFYGDITWLATNGITAGNTNGTFSPTGTVDRESMAAFLYRFANPGKAAPGCTSKPFPDVPVTNPFCGDITWLATHHITGGNADGTYGPLAAVNRESMAAFMYRLANEGATAPKCLIRPFPDVSTANPFCGDITWLVGQGVTDGATDGDYHPSDAVAREAMAAFLHRLNTGGSGLSAPPPVVSAAHYVRTTTSSTLENAGASDAAADQAARGAHLHLLDLGAQSVTPPLSAASPGVVLTQTQTRLTYPALVTLLKAYLAGYQSVVSGGQATVAVGTNSDGCWGTCSANNQTASAKGAQWWTDVVAPLRAYAKTSAPGLTIVGADDIEIGFDQPHQGATQAQVAQWESSYSSAASAAGVTGLQLVFNGSADGCPSRFGQTAGTCNGGWTEAKLASLASGTHIQALPQIYNSAQSIQWANIDSAAQGTITFAGSLTEYAADAPKSQLPNRGWIGLWNALTARQGSPLSAARLPTSADLDVLS